MNGTWPAGLKKTKMRLAIMEILEKATQPLSAADIFEQIRASGETGWYSTVYRTLQTFVDFCLVSEASLPGSDVRCYERIRDVHRHYARCESCDRILPLNACPVDILAKSIPDFRILHHRIELSGLCQNCLRTKEESDEKKSNRNMPPLSVG